MPKANDSGIGKVLAVGALLLLVLNLGKKGTGGGAPAQPSGGLGAVNVSQSGRVGALARQGSSLRQALMGAHLTPKAVGQSISVSVTWTPTTTNGAGTPIPWNYAIDYFISLGGALVAEGTLGTFTNQPPNSPATMTAVIPGLPAVGQYDVRAILYGAVSDGDGNPTGTFGQLATLTHSQAIQVGGGATTILASELRGLLVGGQAALYHLIRGPYDLLGDPVYDVEAIPHPDFPGFLFAGGQINGVYASQLGGPASAAYYRAVTAAEYAPLAAGSWASWLGSQATPLALAVVTNGFQAV